MDVVSHIVKYNAATNGREKLCRFAGYTTRLALSFVRETNENLVPKLKNLEKSLSATRKVMKFGKSLDMIQGAIHSCSVEDPVVRLALILGKLNQAVFLLLDHYVWMIKINVVNADPKRAVRMSAIFWLLTVFFNMVRNVHDVINIVQKEVLQLQSGRSKKVEQEINDDAKAGGDVANDEASHRSTLGISSDKHVISFILKCLNNNRPVLVDVVKNMTDIFLPLAALKYVNMSERSLAILGMISSVMGMLIVWHPALKLVPS